MNAAAQRGDIANPGYVLDSEDAGNYTTFGAEGQGISGCTFETCTASAPFLAIFEPPGYGPRFRLVSGSPAITKGSPTFIHRDKEWVPLVDVDGTVRGTRTGGAPDVGFDQHSNSSRER
ncbi:MAG TPA: hypothetical protein VGJ78_07960 [Vicinamibacterales bacterium]